MTEHSIRPLAEIDPATWGASLAGTLARIEARSAELRTTRSEQRSAEVERLLLSDLAEAARMLRQQATVLGRSLDDLLAETGALLEARGDPPGAHRRAR